MFYIENSYLLCSCTTPWEKSSYISQNSLSQSDRRISKWTILSWANWLNSLIFSILIWPISSVDSKIELSNGINLFFACWYNFMKINLKVLEVGMVKTGCGQSCDGTLKLTVSEQWTDGINWFFACWYRFKKIKSWSKIF